MKVDYEGLRARMPRGTVQDDAATLVAFESDGLTAFRQRPRAVAIPADVNEVVEVVRWCNEHRIPFVARGSGTSLSGGAMPVEDGIVISLNRLRRILEIDPANRVAIVEPGVVNLQVTETAKEFGLAYAPDPSSQKICTIGGNVAYNAGGAHCLKYGMTSNHVVGMKVVTAAGEIVSLGGPALESPGQNLVGLFCGSEGLFGIAVEICVRLLPPPERFHTVLAGFHSLRDAGDAVSAIIESGLLPGAMEIMESLAIAAAEAATECGYPDGAAAVLIVELEGPREKLPAEEKQLAKILESTKAFETVVAADDTQRALIWAGRKSVFSAAGKLSPDFLVQDGVVPRRRLGETLERIQTLSEDSGLRVANVFHAGDGNLHPLIMFDDRIEGELQRAEALAGRILDVCIEMGGSITGEHGVGIEKREYLPKMYDQDTLDLMHRIRRAFDPLELANPGKVFPTGEAPALGFSGLHPLEKAGVIQRD